MAYLLRDWPPSSQRYPTGLDDGSLVARAIRDGSVVHCPDIPRDPGLPSWLRELAQAEGFRSLIVVPMLGDGRAIGTLNVSRPEGGGFTERQIELLRSFASQAVIAIENVRLFQELDARNRELTEALDRQTATSEVLSVIARTRDDVRPVFEMILENAMRLAGAEFGGVYRVTDGLIHVAAFRNPSPGMVEAMARYYPRPPEAEGAVARAIREREVVHVADAQDASLGAAPRELARVGRFRSLLTVPLLRDGVALGAIAVGGAEPGLLSDGQVALVRTFADQAVIAIENVRLFTELEARNRELTEALEQQTATAEILGVISRSPTDLQPVLDAVARSASRLCGAAIVSLYRVEGSLMRKVAEEGPSLTTLRVGDTRPITRATISGRVIVDRATIHVPDYQSAAAAREYPDVRRDTGIRTTIGIPLLREGVGHRCLHRVPDRIPALLRAGDQRCSRRSPTRR